MDTWCYYSKATYVLLTYGVVERVRSMLSSAFVEELEEMERIFSDIFILYLIIHAEIVSEDDAWFSSSNIISRLNRLRTIAYGIEDTLDAAATEQLGLKMSKTRATAPQARTWLLYDLEESITKLRRILSDLLQIFNIEEHTRIAEYRSTFVIHQDPVAAFLSSNKKVTAASSRYYGRLWSLPEGMIVGRESEKEQIIHWIFDDNHQHPNVISIIGEPGIGKTTLAQMIYNDYVHVSSRFDIVLWASPRQSRSTDLKSTVVEIIRSFTNQSWFSLQRMDRGMLEDELRCILAGKMFLLVLDDFKWGYLSVWEELKEIFMVGSAGSTVIRTAEWDLINETTKTLYPKVLHEKDCMSIFMRHAGLNFEKGNLPLWRIGRSIVDKCAGCPLAIKTLGSILRYNRDEHSWMHVNDSKIWYRSGLGRYTSTRASMISIENMLPVLLQCLYLSLVLSKDKVLSREQLILSWMALGLLHSRDANDDPIDIGDRYCDELEFRCFVRSFQSDGHPMVLVHDQTLSSHMMQSEVAQLPSSSPVPDDCRYIVWAGGTYKLFPTDQSTLPSVRTLSSNQYVGPVQKLFLEGLISTLSHVCVLLLDGSEFEELPETIGNLKHLRYLSLAGNRSLEGLPESICGLLNLQSLDLSGCQQLQTLPQNMHKLVSLRHLFMSLKLTSVPEPALKSWTPLHHLRICNCPNLISLSEALQHLTALKVLQIHDCHSITSLPTSIKCLTSLNKLSILNCDMLNLTNWKGLEGLKALQFLQIQGLTKLSKFPEGFEFAADSLQHLVVANCQNLIALPECLQKCTNLVEMVIDNCPKLCTLPKGIPEMKTLQVLKIIDCPKLTAMCQSGVGYTKCLVQHEAYQRRDAPAFPDKVDKGRKHGHVTLEDDVMFPLTFSSPKVPILKSEVHNRDPHPREKPSAALPEIQELEVEKKVESSKTETSIQEESASQYLSTVTDETSVMEEMEDPRSLLFLLPEDYEVEKDTLVQLWMAAGNFTYEPMELSGDEYFKFVIHNENYLLSYGTNFMTGKDRYRINTNKINELLAAQKDNARFYLQWKKDYKKNPMPAESIRHVSLGSSTEIDATTFETLEKFKQLRTLLFLGNSGHRLIRMPSHLFSCFSKLQALDLSRTHMEELPSSIGHMTHLRYLDLSWTLIKWLPDTICSLAELQTLKLRGCASLNVLPEQLNKLIKLRHLDIDVLRQLEVMPKGLGALVHLRTLPAFLVGTEHGCKIGELKQLNKIAGNLCIANLENVKDANEAREAVLYRKGKLKKLELRWTASEICGTHHNSDAILECLRPCRLLEELHVLCYEGAAFPGWVGNPEYEKLVRIVFYRCENLMELRLIEQLPHLKHLELVRMNSVKRIECGGELQEQDVVAFPELEKLEINEMKSLEVWYWEKNNERDYASLTQLIIDNCPNLEEFDLLPRLSSIHYFEIRECPKLHSLSDVRLPDSLEELIVADCPQIQKRCLAGEREDWHKIEHIPNKSIEMVAEDYNDE